MGYQIVVRYHSEAPMRTRTPMQGLAVSVDYDRTRLETGGTVQVRTVVTNNTEVRQQMLLVDIGTPPGFAVRAGALDKLQAQGRIDRYTVTARGVIVYVDSLNPGESLSIRYRMVARMPLHAVAAPTVAYAYYDPDLQASAAAPRVVVH